MYRSFVKCDHPKGVVECGTIRKCRTRSHKMKDQTKIQKTTQNLGTSLMNERYKEEKNVPKVCKGNNLIGPPSLQLTQVSGGDRSLNSMVHSWSRDLKYDGKKSEDIAKCILKGACDLHNSLITLRRFQRASPHTDSFRKKETKKPVRDRIDTNMIGRMQAIPFGEQSNPKGFQRPHTSAGGSSKNCKEELKKVIKESFVRQKMFPKMANEGFDSGSEAFSSSTSQSSGVRTKSLSDPSLSVIASKMETRPSLIVKLMGLEEVPSKSFSPVKQTLLDGDRDMSKVRKIDSTVYPEQMAQRETTDTMNFKGLVKKSFVKEPKLHVHHFDDTNSKKVDDLPHIILMKPQCIHHQESVKSTYMPVPPKEFSLPKLKVEIATSKTIKHRKGSSSTNMGKCVSKWLDKEGPKFLKEVMKLDAKGNNPVEESSSKVKLYSHIGHTSQVNEKIDEKWKVQTISRKQPENDISEPPIVTKPQYQREITSTKLRKLKGLSRIDKNETSLLKSTGRKNQMKSPKSLVAEPEPAKLTCLDCKIINHCMRRDSAQVGIATTLEEELLMVCEADAYINKIGEKCEQRKSSSRDDIIMLLKSEHENYSTTANADKEGTRLKHFLSTNPSFIGHANKLFNLNLDCPNMSQKDENNYSMTNMRLYLDCAYELIERKSLQESQVVRSLLLACGGNSRLHISLGRLVEEICYGVESLKFYKDSEEKVFEDNDVFSMMEKDMKCNGEINGTWERGWERGFSADEAELVVNKIENMLVSGLIEELIINI